MLPEWVAVLPRWLTVGLGAGLVLSVIIAGVFVVVGRLSPTPPRDPSAGFGGADRRRGEIGEYLRAIDEPFTVDHTVRGERVAFYLPRRDVAITFDAQAYFRLAETPTYPILCEHEMPGVHLGRRLPFETPEPGADYRADRIDAEGESVEAAFERLGLDSDADPDAVTAAYRDRVKEVHPDQGGDPETFHEVRDAYDTAKEHASKGAA